MLQLRFKNCFNLFASITVVFALFGIRAYSQFSFSYDDFKFAQRGFYAISPLSNNRYRLTSAIDTQTVAMWHVGSNPSRTGLTLDLSKDFLFNFRIKFGNGANAASSSIADGIVFVMHTLPVKDNLIGNEGWYMGYGGEENNFARLRSSFGIEFDTEWKNGNIPANFDEGGPLVGSGCHTAYLRNGFMAAITGNNGSSTFKPMQNNWGSVRNNEYCVVIRWKRTNGYSDAAGYDLITYIEEKGDSSQNGQLLERNRMHFSSLSDLITALAPDSNGRAYVTWGITSATCLESNSHEIEFVSLQYTYSGNFIFSMIDGPSDTMLVLANTVPINCSPYNPTPYSDTVMNTVVRPCPLYSTYRITAYGLDMTGAKWYVLGNDGLYHEKTGDRGKSVFPLRNYYSDFAGKEHVIVRLILGSGDTVLFKIQFADGNAPFAASMIDTLNNHEELPIKINDESQTGAMLLTNANLAQSIPIPPAPAGCSYNLSYIAGLYDSIPVIRSGKLEFKLKENFCHEPICIERDCGGCKESFTFALAGFNPLVPQVITTCDGTKIKFMACQNNDNYSHAGDLLKLILKKDGVTVGSAMGGQHQFAITNSGEYTITAINTKTNDTLYMPDSIAKVTVTADDLPPILSSNSPTVNYSKDSSGQCNATLVFTFNKNVSNAYTFAGYLTKQNDTNVTNVVNTTTINASGNKVNVSCSFPCQTEPVTFLLIRDYSGSNPNIEATSCEYPATINCICGADPCTGVEMTNEGIVFINVPEFSLHIYYAYSGIAISANKTISNITVTPLVPVSDHRYPELITVRGAGTNLGNVFFTYLCDPAVCCMSYSVPVRICVTFSDGTECCQETNAGYTCDRYIRNIWLYPLPARETININYELHEAALSANVPLVIKMYDRAGNFVRNVYNAVPTSATGTIVQPLNGLQPDLYHVVFQMGNQIERLQFIKSAQ